jgi:hypothetical protein
MVTYSTNDASLDHVITASMQLEVAEMAIETAGANQSWTFITSGTGFTLEDDRNAEAGINVLSDQVAEHGRFAHSRLSDDVEMISSVVLRKTKRRFAAPNVSLANVGNVLLLHPFS